MKELEVGDVVEFPGGYYAQEGEYWAGGTKATVGCTRPIVLVRNGKAEMVAALGSSIKITSEKLGAEQVAKAVEVACKKLKQHPPTGYGGQPQTLSGSDPEIFVRGGSGALLPAYEFLPKKPPYNKDLNYQAYWDGFQAEFTVQPSYCHEVVTRNVRGALDHLLAMAKTKDPEAYLDWSPVVEIPKDVMMAAPDEPAALGCAPSTNIYDKDAGVGVENSRDLLVRFAGCHMHLNWKHLHHDKEQLRAVIESLDKIASIVLTSTLEGVDNSQRRLFYGRAGEYRLPLHGIEYRTPSSAILASPVLFNLAFDFMRSAGAIGMVPSLNEEWQVPGGSDEWREIINYGDVDGARKILRLNERMLKALIHRMYEKGQGRPKRLEKALALIMEGARQHLTLTPKATAHNWRLSSGCSPQEAQGWSMARGGANCSVHSFISEPPPPPSQPIAGRPGLG